MQVETLLSDGLKRRLGITIAAAEFDELLSSKVREITSDIRVPGFRPGKVPEQHVRRVHGAKIASDVLQTAINDYGKRALADLELTPAYDPTTSFGDSPPTVEKLLGGGEDIGFEIELEVMPQIDMDKLAEIKIDRPVTSAKEEEVDLELNAVVEQYRKFEPREEGDAAQAGDQVEIDSVATKDGEPYQALTADGQTLVIRTDETSRLAAIHTTLIGAKSGDVLTVAIPLGNIAADAAGDASETDGAESAAADGEAQCQITVKKVSSPLPVNVDEIAQQIGMEGEVKLRSEVRSHIEQRNMAQSENRAHRRLLDALSEQYDFDLPEKLVEREAASINRMGDEAQKSGEEDKPNPDEIDALARRRVRLGLLFLHIGQTESIQLENADLEAAISQDAQQMGVPAQTLMEYYSKHEEVFNERVRMPAYEKKVVNWVMEKVQVSDVEVSKEELLRDDPSPFDEQSAE